jgi:hypothetical protein
MSGDTKARAEFYSRLSDMGVLSVNDIRELEELNAIDEGDKHLVQINRTTLEKIGEEPPADPTFDEPPAVEVDEEDDGDDVARSMAPLLADTIGRILKTESDKIRRGVRKAPSVQVYVDEFYLTHRDHVRQIISPPVRALAGMCGGDADEMIDSYVVRHVAQSRSDLDDVGVEAAIERWRGDRADDDARQIVEAIRRLSPPSPGAGRTPRPAPVLSPETT